MVRTIRKKILGLLCTHSGVLRTTSLAVELKLHTSPPIRSPISEPLALSLQHLVTSEKWISPTSDARAFKCSCFRKSVQLRIHAAARLSDRRLNPLGATCHGCGTEASHGELLRIRYFIFHLNIPTFWKRIEPNFGSCQMRSYLGIATEFIYTECTTPGVSCLTSFFLVKITYLKNKSPVPRGVLHINCCHS